MPPTIREADLELSSDADALLQLLDHYARDEMGGGAPLDSDVRQRLIPGLRQVANKVILLAEVDGRPAGLAVAFPVFSTFRASPVLNLHDLAVHADFRGQGIGRALLCELEVMARQRGCCRISLEVRVDNVAAQRLYQSVGYSAGDAPQEFWKKTLED